MSAATCPFCGAKRYGPGEKDFLCRFGRRRRCVSSTVAAVRALRATGHDPSRNEYVYIDPRRPRTRKGRAA